MAHSFVTPLEDGEEPYDERWTPRLHPVDPGEHFHPDPAENPPARLWAVIQRNGHPGRWMSTTGPPDVALGPMERIVEFAPISRAKQVPDA